MGTWEELMKKGKGNIDKAIEKSIGVEDQEITPKQQKTIDAIMERLHKNVDISAREVSGRAWDKERANATQSGDDIKLILERGEYQKKSPKIPMK